MFGERALLMFEPGLDYIAAFFGCLYAGVIAVPAYPPSPRRPDRLASLIADARPKAVLSDRKLAKRLQRVFDCRWPGGKPLWFVTDEVGSRDGDLWQPWAVEPERTAFLQYTSGSTGNPKGVMVSHGNLLANQALIRETFEHSESSTVVGWLPLYHDMGLIGNILQPFYLGATSVLMSPSDFLEKPRRWLAAISTFRAVTSGGPNFAYDLCVRKIGALQKKDLHLSSWRLAFNGSEPVRPATMRRFAEAFAECGFRRDSFFPCYGLAEATLFVAGERWLGGRKGEGRREHELPSYGSAPRNHEIRIVDVQSGAPCAENEVGEIWLAGPSVAQGYWDRPDETGRIFGARLKGSRSAMYLRTGDLGFLRDGKLYVTGWIKDLIIVRGRNYHPHDIEHHLTERLKDLRPGNCAAFSVPGEGGEALVVVAEVKREALRRRDYAGLVEAMRDILVEYCELSPADLVLVAPGSVPKTTSGKVRRRACRQDYLNGHLHNLASPEKPAAAPDPDTMVNTQRVLRQALGCLSPEQRAPLIVSFLIAECARVLGIPKERIASTTNLQSLGLDSLMTLELKHAVERLLNCEIPMDRFFGRSTLVELAESLCDRGVVPPTSAPPETVNSRPVADARTSDSAGRTLSAGQRRVWAMRGSEPGGIGDNLHRVLCIEERLDSACLHRCLDRLIERHAVLRTVFRGTGASLRQQTVPRAEIPDCFDAVDATDWSDEQLQTDWIERARTPFDLERGPLLRVVLYGHAAERTTLLVCAHRIAVDFWSLSILLGELEACYRNFLVERSPQFAPLRRSYVDYVRQQRAYLGSDACERDWSYWRERLAGPLPVLAIPRDRRPAETGSHAGASVALRLDAEVSRSLKNRARATGVTLFSLLLAAYNVLLFRHTRSTDLIVGIPATGRAAPDFAAVVGNFENPVPVRTRPQGAHRFSDYLQEVHEAVTGALSHQEFALPMLLERLRIAPDRACQPLYQTLFVLHQVQSSLDTECAGLALGEDSPPVVFGGWRVRGLALRERIERLDLKVTAADLRDGLLFSFQYRSGVFERATIERLAAQFEELIHGILHDPKTRLCELPLISSPQLRRMLLIWNSTRRDYPRGDFVHRCFERQAARSGESRALVLGREWLSYRELNARANRLAHALIAAGIGADARVGLCVDRSVEMVVGLLGILKAGGAFVSLDPGEPAERRAAMLEEVDVRMILTRTAFREVLLDSGLPVWALDGGEWRIGEKDFYPAKALDFNPGLRIDRDNLAYVLFASEANGRPKGVGIPHRGLFNRLAWMQERFGLDGSDALLQDTPPTRDASFWEVFWPLMTGARLVLVPPAVPEDAEKLVALIEEHRVSTLHFAPSRLAAFLDSAVLSRCGSLRRVIASGEALSVELRDRFLRRSTAELHILYGPPEASIDVSAWFCDRNRNDATVPIGQPIANTQIYLLDDFLNPVPVGVPGEICIAGVQLARGYLARPGLTAAHFVPNPFGEAGERLYRTGEFARYRPDGTIEPLPRIE